MSSATTGFWAYSRTRVSVILLANLFPLLGVFVFDWGVTELLVVYWLEAGVALPVGFVKTGPTRLVSFSVPDSRREPSIWIRRGSITVGGLPIYVRNGPLLAMVLGGLGVWLATGLLAFYRSASPFTYSTTAATFPTVVGVAGLLALSQLVTVRPYFADRRYCRMPPAGAASPSLAYVFGVASLTIMLADLTDHPLNISWLTAYPIAIAGGKASLELLTRCRNRARFERIDAEVDPFTDERTVRQQLTSKQLTAELPLVSRPDAPPQTTVRPARSHILGASPFVGLDDRISGIWFGLPLAFAVAIVPLGGSVSFASKMGGIAFGGLTLSGLAISYPRHATLEYEFYDDRLVCHDYWLERAQWQLPYEDIEAIETTQSRVGRLLGYGTVTIETADDQPARLAYLREHEDVADRLERATERVSRAAVQ